MAFVPNSAIGSFEQMLAEVQANGTSGQKKLAERLHYGYINVGLGLEVSLELHRQAMAKLLAEVRAKKPNTF